MALFFTLPEWFTAVNFLIGIFAVLLGVAGFVLWLIVRRRSDISVLQLDRATAAEGLLRTRDAEIKGLNDKLRLAEERNEALEEELESTTAEHRTTVGIKLGELMDFWAIKEDLQAKLRDLEEDLRIERRRRNPVIPGSQHDPN